MIVKTTTQVGNPLIRGKAKSVANPKTKAIQKIIEDLTDSMRHHQLVGMAAPQIGKNVRVFVTEIRKTKLRKGQSVRNVDKLRVFINPKITKYSKQQIKGWEGCGSVASAHLFGMVSRPKSISVTALDENGDEFTLEVTGLLARVIQHECDHLDGIVFTDKADVSTFTSRDEYLKMKLMKLKE